MGLGGVESRVWRLTRSRGALGSGGPWGHVVRGRSVGGRQVRGGLQIIHPAPQTASAAPCTTQAGSVSGGLGHVIHYHWSLEAAISSHWICQLWAWEDNVFTVSLHDVFEIISLESASQHVFTLLTLTPDHFTSELHSHPGCSFIQTRLAWLTRAWLALSETKFLFYTI